MTLSYTGGMTSPVDAMRTLIANSSTFQDWVDADDATEAKAFIFLFEMLESAIVFPSVIISMDKWKSNGYASSSTGTLFINSGSLIVQFQGLAPESYVASSENGIVWWLNQMESILDDMRSLSATGGYLDIKNIESTFGPARFDETRRHQGGDVIQQIFNITWGYE